MLKGNHKIFNLLVIFVFSIIFITVHSEKTENCQLYNVSSNNKQKCSKCLFGYELNEENECHPNQWVRVLLVVMAMKYLQPFVEFKSIFIDFVGQFWFLASNQTHSFVSKKMTQFLITINNQRLWPFEIKDRFENFIGKQRIKSFHNFLGLKEQIFPKDQTNLKRDLFLLDKNSFSFTSTCILRLICSFGISLAVWIGLQILDGVIFLLTDHRLLEKREIKGAFILMAFGQFYQFVGFYGFYQIKNFEGFLKFGMRINLLLTICVVFLFLFMTISLLPLLNNLASNHEQDILISQSNFNTTEEQRKVHRVLTFANNPEGYFYYLVNSYFRQFFTGCIIGYFSEESCQYILLAIWYVAEYIFLETVSQTLEFKVHFVFRKGFILSSIVYLLLSFEQNVHMLQYHTYSYQPALEICLCLLYVLGVLEFLLKFAEYSWRFLSKIKIWLKKSKNRIENLNSKNLSKLNPKIRKAMREPSIAQKVLKKLKSLRQLQNCAEKYVQES